MSAKRSVHGEAGLPNFSLDEEGFPVPGLVIKYFREHMKYINAYDNKERSWTQANLAKSLGVSEVTIRLMENQNIGLDSITRRRLVADILKIPPVLLGLGSLSELKAYLDSTQQHSTFPNTSSSQTKGTHIEKETVSLYNDIWNVYSEMHSTGSAQGSLSEIEKWASRIKDDVLRTHGSQQRQLQEILWDFYALVAKIYGDDLCDWSLAFANVNAAMELAVQLDNNELRAATLYRSGQIHFAQRKFSLAKADFDGATKFAQRACPQLKGPILGATGLAYALTSKDMTSKKYVQSLLDEAGNLVTSSGFKDDGRFIKFSVAKYYLEYADTLTVLGRPGKALEVLDDAESAIDISQKRRRAYMDILRAEANMRLSSPQLHTATFLLADAFNVSKGVRSEYNIGYIARLYTNLRDSSYGNSTDVADLGMSLKRWKQTHTIKKI